MSQESFSGTPLSPEVQPEEVRDELDQEYVTHQGDKLPPSRDRFDAQRHMGAMEDNVTPVMPPVIGPARVTDAGDEDDHDVNPRTELTPG
jgi:hypothetical protein